jgi:hypothetical protein
MINVHSVTDFIDRAYSGNGLRRILLDEGQELYDHIRVEHHKVWIRKGNRGRWMDADKVQRLAEAAERNRPSI